MPEVDGDLPEAEHLTMPTPTQGSRHPRGDDGRVGPAAHVILSSDVEGANLLLGGASFPENYEGHRGVCVENLPSEFPGVAAGNLEQDQIAAGGDLDGLMGCLDLRDDAPLRPEGVHDGCPCRFGSTGDEDVGDASRSFRVEGEAGRLHTERYGAREILRKVRLPLRLRRLAHALTTPLQAKEAVDAPDENLRIERFNQDVPRPRGQGAPSNLRMIVTREHEHDRTALGRHPADALDQIDAVLTSKVTVDERHVDASRRACCDRLRPATTCRHVRHPERAQQGHDESAHDGVVIHDEHVAIRTGRGYVHHVRIPWRQVIHPISLDDDRSLHVARIHPRRYA